MLAGQDEAGRPPFKLMPTRFDPSAFGDPQKGWAGTILAYAADLPQCNIVDVNYATGQVLILEGDEDMSALSIVSIAKKTKATLSATDGFRDCLFSPRGDRMTYKIESRDNAGKNKVECGIYDLQTGQRYLLYRGENTEATAFWLSNNRVCYIHGSWNQETKKPEFQMFSASATGKAAYQLDDNKDGEMFNEIEITGLHYWDSYARACPQVSVLGRNGGLLSIGEIIKNANDKSKRTRETLEIPVDLLDLKNPVILYCRSAQGNQLYL